MTALRVLPILLTLRSGRSAFLMAPDGDVHVAGALIATGGLVPACSFEPERGPTPRNDALRELTVRGSDVVAVSLYGPPPAFERVYHATRDALDVDVLAERLYDVEPRRP